jgi:hypothetical protein
MTLDLHSQSTRRICQLGLLIAIGLGPSDSMPTPLNAASIAASSCIVDNYCDTLAGENCETCSQDCTCSCGDGVCSDQARYDETCENCAEDCGYQCICGDFVCNWPWEYGGAGSGYEPECNPQNPGADCTYCPTDCGGCDIYWCDPLVCSTEHGQCTECTNYQQCAYSNQFCNFTGECETVYEYCDYDWQCQVYDEGYYCWDGLCVPPWAT